MNTATAYPCDGTACSTTATMLVTFVTHSERMCDRCTFEAEHDYYCQTAPLTDENAFPDTETHGPCDECGEDVRGEYSHGGATGPLHDGCYMKRLTGRLTPTSPDEAEKVADFMSKGSAHEQAGRFWHAAEAYTSAAFTAYHSGDLRSYYLANACRIWAQEQYNA